MALSSWFLSTRCLPCGYLSFSHLGLSECISLILLVVDGSICILTLLIVLVSWELLFVLVLVIGSAIVLIIPERVIASKVIAIEFDIFLLEAFVDVEASDALNC